MGQVRDYEALIRELLVGVEDGWSYGYVTIWLWNVDEEELTLWLREFAKGLSLERDRELIEQLKLLGKMTPGKLASEALMIVARLDSSYRQGLELPNHKAWFDRGNELFELGRYEEAIASYDRAIKINPDYHEAWANRGITLYSLGRDEDAIASYDQAVEIKPDKHDAWYNRGIALVNLERYAEAIASYDRAVEIKSDEHQAWSNRGIVLRKLGRYAEAIASYDRAIEINPDDHEYWHNRGIAIGFRDRSYQAEIDAYCEAFKHIHAKTHPEGWGFLQHKIGLTHHEEGNNQLLNYRRDPQIYYGQALTSYKEALTTLTREQFPKLRLETLIDTTKTYLAQKNLSAARDCQTEALTISLELIDAQPSPQGKKRLYLEYNYLLSTQVDLSILDGEPIRALEIAEFDKNKHLEWFLYAQEQQGQTASLILKQIDQLRSDVFGLQYSQMRQLLTPNQAIVYWHLSPDHLTTFILHSNQPKPEILTSSSQQLRDWLKIYDTANLDTINWQELGNILEVSKINHHLDGIEHLILIPHRDLHHLPLHIYWQNLTTTYLPSIQVGLNLKKKPQPDQSAGFLLVESPDYSQPTKLKSITKSFDSLTNPKVESAIIAHLFQPKTTIPTGKVSKDILSATLNIPHSYGHFNGHAFHDSRRPQDSSLVIDCGEFTCQDLAQIDLTPYYLISLSACETGITAHQSIDTEYVGLVSAFLSRGTSYVVSTLWSVKDLPSSLLMMTFYLYLNKGDSAPLALYKAAHWLKNLTYAEEAQFHQNVYQRLHQNSESEQTTARTVDRNRKIAENNAKENPAGKPYCDPKYWAAFTISGWGQSEM
jgi:CHAT domain-containing protein/Flp pilus assembly protein TadD